MKTKLVVIAVVFAVLVTAVVLFLKIGRPAARHAPPLKRPAVSAARKEKASLPSVTKKFANPQVAIVIDDFGYNMNNMDELFRIKEPVTLSILPHLPHSKAISSAAAAKGYEVILHLPLEPHREDVRQEIDTIKSTMSAKEVVAKLEEAMASVADLSGVSSHMGSKATEEKGLMKTIFGELKKKDLYFLDSVTSRRSVCREVASEVGIKYARRDVFLDMGRTDSANYIRKQLLETRRIAFKKGRAIAVCHDRRITIGVLAEMMPRLASDGIRFVYLSDMVN